MTMLPQPASAKRMYDARAQVYDDSWHPSFARDFIAAAPLSPGQKLLDLACGTGLVTFLAAEAVGPTGSVTGVDISSGMLAVARRKASAEPGRWKHVRFFEHSVTHLDSLEDVATEKGTFDAITIASAFVLLSDPATALASWISYLKPGGHIVLDVAHPQNLIAGAVFERVARRIGTSIPYHRAWVKGPDSLKELLQQSGLECERPALVEQAGYRERFYDGGPEEADRHFADMVEGAPGQALREDDKARQEDARLLFREEWTKEAQADAETRGRVREVDGVYLAVAQKPPADHGDADADRTGGGPAPGHLKGGCRCGAVQYATTAKPPYASACHCRTCQKLSGAGYMACFDLPVSSVVWLGNSLQALGKVHVTDTAERAFCKQCGAPMYMRIFAEEGNIYLMLSSVDEGLSERGDVVVGRHIFLREKAAWEVLPGDGAERWEEWSGGRPWKE